MRHSVKLHNIFIQRIMKSVTDVSSDEMPWKEDPSNALIVKTKSSSYAVQKKQEDQENQDAYNFLHRAPHRHSDLGGYGEDLGFHYPPRAFIDPDFPHIAPFYNRWHQCANLRESRYSHHRRMLKSLDIAKLVRHGRILPLPHKLLNDYLMSKIPLKDPDCAAFFDYAHSILIKSRGAREEGEAYFSHIQDMFERLLATKLPPSDVGPKTHAAVIRCCSELKKFTEGYHWFRKRAGSIKLTHTVDLYDSIIELCEKCEMVEEAWSEFNQLIESKMRVPPITLCRMLRIAALEKNYRKGRDVWDLFDYFRHQKNGNIYAAGLEWLSECEGRGREALSMITEMYHFSEKLHAEQVTSSCSSHKLAADSTYDRFSCKIIHNNVGPYSSGISLYNPENQSYSNNQSIAEYESQCYLRTLQPNVDMILHVLYSLIKTDSETYKLAWDFFNDQFLRAEVFSTGRKSINEPSAFTSFETLTYMFFGASLHKNVDIAMKLLSSTLSNPRLIGVNLMPQAIFYWLKTIRQSFQTLHSLKQNTTAAPNKPTSEIKAQLSTKIDNLIRLQKLYGQCTSKHKKSSFDRFVDSLERALTYQYATAVHESRGKREAIDAQAQSGLTFSAISRYIGGKSDHLLCKTIDSRHIKDKISLDISTIIEIPSLMETSVMNVLRKNPRSAHEEWIFTEYIGALSNFPWAITLPDAYDRPSYSTGFRKVMSLIKHLTARNSPINIRTITYALDVVYNHALESCKHARISKETRPEKDILQKLLIQAQEMQSNLLEILQIIQSHQSAVHFVSCDTIRYKIYHISGFINQIEKQNAKNSAGMLTRMINMRWNELTNALPIRFYNNPLQKDLSGPLKKIKNLPSGDIKNMKAATAEWQGYQNDLWGSDPEDPPAPRRSEKIKAHFNFSREDKSLAKFGQKVHSPRLQTSF